MLGANSNQPVKYLALIGDLVGSRSLSAQERAEVQNRFQKSLDHVNESFRDDIASLFLITAGDETQGILRRPHRCYQIIRQIQFDLAPTEIVFGLGYGTLTTDVGEYAVGADGPAFYLARQALEEAKTERKAYGKSILREVRMHSEDQIRDKIVDALFLSLAVFKSHWTEQQARIVNALEQGKSPKEVSELLDIPLPNISRAVEAARFREFEMIADSLKTMFEHSFASTYHKNDK